MTIMWTASSFGNYLLNFLNKYLEGSIFLNNYFEGIAGIIATIIGASLYSRFGKKNAFVYSFGLALIGGILVYLFETDSITLPDFFLATFPGTPKMKHAKAISFLVPKVTFIAKFGISLAFLSTYQASFSDDTIFPAAIRATAIGSCQFFARGLTILAPEITELPSPQPIICFICIASLALLTSLTFSEPIPKEEKV